jgi:hypothetical protein
MGVGLLTTGEDGLATVAAMVAVGTAAGGEVVDWCTTLYQFL